MANQRYLSLAQRDKEYSDTLELLKKTKKPGYSDLECYFPLRKDLAIAIEPFVPDQLVFKVNATNPSMLSMDSDWAQDAYDYIRNIATIVEKEDILNRLQTNALIDIVILNGIEFMFRERMYTVLDKSFICQFTYQTSDLVKDYYKEMSYKLKCELSLKIVFRHVLGIEPCHLTKYVIRETPSWPPISH